jgi:hypothetical protein
MTTAVEPTCVTVPELALRLLAVRGKAKYAAYLVPLEEVPAILAELDEALIAFDHSIDVAVLDVVVAADLFGKLADVTDEFVLVSTTSYSSDDWRLLDRRRSSLAHAGVMVLVMTKENFDHLMRAAPNLVSWLDPVLQHSHEAPELAETRERRLATLRSWARRSDDEIVQAAVQGMLPADPEYGEWLVLLGRGDLLDRVK